VILRARDTDLICPPARENWYPRLLHATPTELANWKILGNGEGIRWADLDEDLSVAGTLLGTRAAKHSLSS
jgi:Protein of unknown function (DUF2442)